VHVLKRSPDAVAGLAAAVLGVVYLVAAFQIEPDPSTTSVVGPQVAPIVIGTATVVCALALFVRGLRAPDAAPAPAAEHTDDARVADDRDLDAARRLSRRQVVVTFGIFTAYIVAFIPLGYLLSTFGFLVAMTTYVDRSKLLRNCVYGAVFAPCVYVLFNYGLQVQLPPGLLG
jgi:putative tricarboxylic transport membrane protein